MPSQIVRPLLSKVFLLFVIPLIVGLHFALSSRAPYWDLPWSVISLSSALSGCAALLLQAGLMQLRLWVLKAVSVVFILLSVSFLVSAFFIGFFWYSVFAITVPLLLFSIWVLLSLELRRSFRDPRLSWFEGHPRTYPQLTCKWAEGQEWSAQVCRLDEEGAFLVLPVDRMSAVQNAMKLELSFALGSTEGRARGQVSRVMDPAWGFGVKFTDMSYEESQKWGDFIEQVRGKGYV